MRRRSRLTNAGSLQISFLWSNVHQRTQPLSYKVNLNAKVICPFHEVVRHRVVGSNPSRSQARVGARSRWCVLDFLKKIRILGSGKKKRKERKSYRQTSHKISVSKSVAPYILHLTGIRLPSSFPSVSHRATDEYSNQRRTLTATRRSDVPPLTLCKRVRE